MWQSFSDPLAQLLEGNPESQFDLLETRHALEGIAAYYAAPVVQMKISNGFAKAMN